MEDGAGDGEELIPTFVLGAALAASQAAAAQTPEAFMQQLYAGYGSPNFSPLTDPARYFTARLVTALNEDARLANGEVGYLDGDPVCQCQDAGGLHATVAKVTRSKPGKAKVRVAIGIRGYEPRYATFSLVLTEAGWRIADVASADEPSLLRGIEESNRRIRSKH